MTAPPTAAAALALTFPWPPAALSPNARGKWSRIKAVAAYRDECTYLARSQRVLFPALVFPLRPPVKAHVTFILPDKIRRDGDNLIARFKPGFDALTLAGVIAGDDLRVFTWTWGTEQGTRRSAGVRVSLSAGEAA